MKIHKNYNLSKLNTFGISARSKFFAEIVDETDFKELSDTSEFKKSKKLFLGGGSNVLFTKGFDGLVVLNKLKGIEIITRVTLVEEDNVYIRAMGGEIWHDLVTFAVRRGLWGIENLALIPGTVGAAPMQNIGAYGTELKDVLINVEAFDINTGEKRIFAKKECELGYRESVFKNKLKDKYFIMAVTLKLSKIPKPNLSYKILSDYLEKSARRGGDKIIAYSPQDISNAVTAIRKSKLPNPTDIPNAGSFFKNVLVPLPKLRELLQAYPDLPYFEEPSDAKALAGNKDGSKASVLVKIPSGWLIEQCGPADGTSWKGYRIGNVGVHEKQALVLVNHGGASGEEILALANKIIADVKEKFGLELVPEVNLI